MGKPVFLIGYMGSGKTTLGKALARATGRTFIDLDEFIEESQHRTISEIFDEMGEIGFREIEREALDKIARKRDCIIATGGGTVCREGVMERLNAIGVTVWLEPMSERLLARLYLPEERARRPKIATLNDEQIANLVERETAERKPYYRQALLRFDSTYLESETEIAHSARELARELAI